MYRTKNKLQLSNGEKKALGRKRVSFLDATLSLHNTTKKALAVILRPLIFRGRSYMSQTSIGNEIGVEREEVCRDLRVPWVSGILYKKQRKNKTNMYGVHRLFFDPKVVAFIGKDFPDLRVALKRRIGLFAKTAHEYNKYLRYALSPLVEAGKKEEITRKTDQIWHYADSGEPPPGEIPPSNEESIRLWDQLYPVGATPAYSIY
jgi:hypothetical protein